MTEDMPGIPSPVQPVAREYVGLLTEVMTNTLDQDYVTVAATRQGARRTGSSSATRVALLAVLVTFGAILAISALKTDREQPQAAVERSELVAEIHHRQDDQAALTSQMNQVQDAVTALQGSVGTEVSRNTVIAQRLSTLGVDAGTLPVQGPGMVLTLDDAPPTRQSSGGTILDTDLQSLVNGLWIAGAEAIAIDGHRLTSLTSIRFAGQAITVDNVSLTPPYTIVAIGDPATLPARLLETDGGQTWLGLSANFGILFDRQTKGNISVPGDPREHLLYAKPQGVR